MDPNTFPTKGNLILAKSSLTLARQGYELMDKKRNILIKELMGLIEEAKGIQSEIDTTFTAAYRALQKANIELGINYVQDIAAAVPVDDTVRIKTRSIMGTEIPLVQHEEKPLNLTYAYYSTKESLDEARYHFEKVKELTVKLSMVENSAYHWQTASSGHRSAPTRLRTSRSHATRRSPETLQTRWKKRTARSLQG